MVEEEPVKPGPNGVKIEVTVVKIGAIKVTTHHYPGSKEESHKVAT